MHAKTILIAMLCPLFMLGQNIKMDKKRKQIESQKIAFITNHLELTPEEAQVFWPVYNEYTAALKNINEGRRKNSKEIREDIESLSDKEIAKRIDNHIILDQKELDIKKKYHAEFKKVLSNKKIAKLYHSEDQFKRELLKRLKGEKGKRTDYKRK